MRIWFFCMIGILGLMGCKEEVVEDLPQDNDVCGAVALSHVTLLMTMYSCAYPVKL